MKSVRQDNKIVPADRWKMSLLYAIQIYSSFTKNHARATEIFNRLYRPDVNYILSTLLKKNKKWRKYKKCIKMLEHMETKQKGGRFDASTSKSRHIIRQNLVWALAVRWPADFQDRLRDSEERIRADIRRSKMVNALHG